MASISLKNVTLEYPLYEADRSFRKELLGGSIGGVIGRRKGSRRPHVTALQDINFELRDGTRLGLIGPNGAGKSTLIKMLGGIFEPTYGSVTISGRSSTLLTTGVGLDPDDTGYENIVTCGLYLGLKPEEIAMLMPEIAEFTELGEFLNFPVKTYSAGMQLRLTFAITTSLSPEIILMDEAISAGDISFHHKAKRRFDEMIGKSSIVVLASHSRNLIEELCTEAAILDHGQIVARGPARETLDHYEQMNKTGPPAKAQSA